MKSLVLAEKPSVARDIARVLGCHKNIFRCDRRQQLYRHLGTRPSGLALADPENMIKVQSLGYVLSPDGSKEMGARRDQTDIQTIP